MKIKFLDPTDSRPDNQKTIVITESVNREKRVTLENLEKELIRRRDKVTELVTKISDIKTTLNIN